MESVIFCPVRKLWVAKLPEEEVRQALILKMVSELGYPLDLMGVEKELSLLPHIPRGTKVPQRRADLIVFGKDIHPKHTLYPLLLVECKAVKIDNTTLNQLAGYNHFVQAFFVAMANHEECVTGFYDTEKGDFKFYSGLFHHDELVAFTKKVFYEKTHFN